MQFSEVKIKFFLKKIRNDICFIGLSLFCESPFRSSEISESGNRICGNSKSFLVVHGHQGLSLFLPVLMNFRANVFRIIVKQKSTQNIKMRKIDI